jgi:death-on-curing protein
MRYLTLNEVLDLYHRVMLQSGGKQGLHSLESLESAIVTPKMTFDSKELYPSPAEKAAVLGFALITNHPFLDGNKRIGHAAMEAFLLLNGLELQAPIDEQEEVIMGVASGQMARTEFTQWLQSHIVPRHK